MKNFTDLFKQAQEMQSKMAEVQAALAKKSVEASAGGGMVKITANGLGEILAVNIDPECINMQDREILEDLILGAVNEMTRKVNELRQEDMTRLAGGLKIPGFS